jgi:uncharacterized protein (TIGR02302 family)
LLGLWTVVPGWLHAGALAGFIAAVLIALLRGLRAFRLPDHVHVRRRLERATGVPHRPLTALQDQLATDPRDPMARALWQAHQRRMAEAARRLRVGLPSPGLARLDPLALRFAALIALIAAVGLAGDRVSDRLGHAFAPEIRTLAAGEPWQLAVWIAPPEYTGAPPVWLETGKAPGSPIIVPAGSVVLGQFEGGRAAPAAVVAGAATPFEPAGDKVYQLELTLESGDSLAITRGEEELARWPLSVLPDEVPTAAFARAIEGTLRGAIRVEYVARDDYALEGVRAEIRRTGETEAMLNLTVPLPEPGAKDAAGISFHDLTAHPWAGTEVTVQLVATDGIGQEGRSDVATLVLPERIFSHPVARLVAEQRRRLTVEPENRRQIAEILRALTTRPERYLDQSAVTLALSAASARLVLDRSDAATGAVQELLWYTALAIEDGPLALAEQALRDLQQRIFEALAEGATDAEIQQLLDQLDQALNEFLRELSKQAEQDEVEGSGEEDAVNEAIESGELQQMIEEARELMRAGSREAARAMLARLQEILENLKAGRTASLNQGLSSEAAAMMQNLRQLMKGQRELLDDTYSGAQSRGEPDLEALRLGAANQDSLMRGLRQFMQRLEQGGFDVPRSFGRAERAMGRAYRALEEGLPSQAVGPQTDALDQLQQGAQTLLEQFTQEMAQGNGRDNIGFFAAPRDPMGRPVLGQGLEDAGDVEIPDKASLQQIHEILEELYRRASDRRRPELEQNYLERLLRRF